MTKNRGERVFKGGPEEVEGVEAQIGNAIKPNDRLWHATRHGMRQLMPGDPKVVV